MLNHATIATSMDPNCMNDCTVFNHVFVGSKYIYQTSRKEETRICDTEIL